MHIKAGLIFLLMLPTLLLAQVSGSVDSIGFGNHVRPDCWIPLVITLTPDTARTDTYQVRVKVQDMDRDFAIYERTITVTGAADGQTRQQQFRMYFRPPPVDDGLPDWNSPNALKELQDRVQVSIYNAGGSKWITDLPLTTAVRNVDPNPSAFGARRGAKLILAVTEGRSAPIYRDTTTDLMGVLEDVIFVTLNPRDLPEKVIGYEAVDGIVWFDADPAALKAAGDEKFRALEAYVRQGGRLTICQPAEWQKTLAFDDLLPVRILGIDEKDDLMPLRKLAQPPSSYTLTEQFLPSDPFSVVKPPYRFARAEARPGTVIGETITWQSADDVTPYIVRMPYGLGAVTWVAQDLGDPAVVQTRNGWVYVWDRVFDWNNAPLPVTNRTPDPAKQQWEQSAYMDVGRSLSDTRLDLQSRSAWMITLAFVFFIGYWLIAGPGVYTYLATRRQTQLSWFAFGVSALAATALTVLIVRLVLRGPPQLQHFSVVRVAPDEPAVVTSRFGLYIPRDGEQRLALRNPAPDTVTTLTPLPVHPYHLRTGSDIIGQEYFIPVVDEAAGQTAAISVPYRSTLKKFEAFWIGNTQGRVEGSARLLDQNWIAGKITNGTNQRLVRVYIAFHHPTMGGDWLLYLPSWDPGITLDLTREFNIDEDGGRLPAGFTEQTRPDGRRKVRGRLQLNWQEFWLAGTGKTYMSDDAYNDSGSPFPRSLIMMSLFDRMVPDKNDNVRGQANRIDILRRGGRGLDISHALSAGQLVIVAESEPRVPLPMPLEVEGEKVAGEGSILYQFVLPLDRGELASTTQPIE